MRLLAVILAPLGALVACEAGPGAGEDAAPGAVRDAVVDGATEGPPDAIVDGRLDASVDASLDAVVDAMSDVAPDVMVDAMHDAMPDAIVDTMPDAIPDAPPDALVDATPETDRERRCDDGLDGDRDGVADCADGDCLAADPCAIVPETPVQHVQELFLQRCGCHTGAVEFGGLTLERPFTDTTVGVPAVLAPELRLIEPGDHRRSFIYLKISGEHPPGTGERMPPEMPYLDAAQSALVADWIDGLPPR